MSYSRNSQLYSIPNRQKAISSHYPQQYSQQQHPQQHPQQQQPQQRPNNYRSNQASNNSQQFHPQQNQHIQQQTYQHQQQAIQHNSDISRRPPAELPTKPRSFSHNQQKPILRLRPLSDCNEQCSLLQRRTSRRSQQNSSIHLHNTPNQQADGNSNKKTVDPSEVQLTGVLFNELRTRAEVCEHCKDHFLEDEKMMNLHGKVWHERCFVCAQCFQPFPDGVFFEFEDRRYCEEDFQTLFAPQCHQCKEFIKGRVIKAVNVNWHPDCFRCELCQQALADTGFVRNNKKSLCKECHEKEKVRLLGKTVCYKCRAVVDENDFLKFKGEIFHAYHFNCHNCRVELNSVAREKDKELYCLRCYDKLGVPICAACRRPVEEKVIHALGKIWHVEHFVCCQCEKPFFGNRHYEDRGMAYCELHYFQMRGGTCFYCNSVITGNEFTALNKSYCEGHFSCFSCNKKMDSKSKFMELDAKPICKNCFKKLPSELVKRLKKTCS